MWMITEGCRCLCQNKFQTTLRWQKSCWSQRLTNGRGSANSGLKDLLTNQQRRGDPPLWVRTSRALWQKRIFTISSKFAQFILPLELQDRIENWEFRIPNTVYRKAHCALSSTTEYSMQIREYRIPNTIYRVIQKAHSAFSSRTEYSKQDRKQQAGQNMEYRKLNTV